MEIHQADILFEVLVYVKYYSLEGLVYYAILVLIFHSFLYVDVPESLFIFLCFYLSSIVSRLETSWVIALQKVWTECVSMALILSTFIWLSFVYKV